MPNAPTLNASASSVFPAILEGATSPAGVTVASLVVNGSITDADGAAVEAIAITALDTSLGSWQYSLDGGAHWLTIRADLINSSTNELALLLGPTAKIRMLPFGDLNGTLASAITFRAWDQSSGNQGEYVAIASSGGTTAFSAATDTASLTVTAVNDAPNFASGDGTGKAFVSVSSGYDSVSSVTLQPDGKIIVAGYSGSGFALIRLNADGSLDTSFDADGKVTVPLGIYSGGGTPRCSPTARSSSRATATGASL